ncbi:MAG: hypothetical protein ABL994_09625 [Verrucomicrobiales bacterium]
MALPSPPSTPRYQPAKPLRQPPGRVSRLISQFVGVLLLIGILVIATGVAPVSWITFERIDGKVRARTQSCVFFIVPYHTTRIEPVTRIDTRTRSGSDNRERRTGRTDRYVKADDVGYLKIEGPSQSAEVPVAPSSLKSIEEKARGFLDDTRAVEIKLFVVANWTLSLVFSGLATVLYGIIAGCFAFAAARWILRKMGFIKTRR